MAFSFTRPSFLPFPSIPSIPFHLLLLLSPLLFFSVPFIFNTLPFLFFNTLPILSPCTSLHFSSLPRGCSCLIEDRSSRGDSIPCPYS
jgi:hypothetical protein